jgi:hypothetical protein
MTQENKNKALLHLDQYTVNDTSKYNYAIRSIMVDSNRAQEFSKQRTKDELANLVWGNYWLNRPVNEDHVDQIKEAMLAKPEDFYGSQMVFAAIESTINDIKNIRFILVDGQHRLTALSQTKLNIPFQCKIIFLKNDKDAEIHALYNAIDQNHKNRGFKELCRSWGLSAKYNCPEAYLKSVSAAIKMMYRGMHFNIDKKGSHFSAQEELNSLNDWKDQIIEYWNILNKPENDKQIRLFMRQAPFIAVAFMHMKTSKKGLDFWEKLASGKPGNNVPLSLLDNNIRSNSYKSISCSSRKSRMIFEVLNAYIDQIENFKFKTFNCNGKTKKEIQKMYDAPIEIKGSDVFTGEKRKFYHISKDGSGPKFLDESARTILK